MHPTRQKVNKAGSLIEITAALALLLAVTFFVAVQDSISVVQAQNDARKAAALLWLENETALVRGSLPPWTVASDGGAPYLTLYNTNFSQTSSLYVDSNVPLIGDVSSRLFTNEDVSDFAQRFTNCTVRRALLARDASGYDGLFFDTYLIEVEIPKSTTVSGPPQSEKISRTVRRTFTAPDI